MSSQSQLQIIRENMVWHRLLITMISLYLLADMFAGFSILYLGIDLKISLLYKMPILFLLLILIGQSNLKVVLGIISLILAFFIGPLYQLVQYGRIDIFVFDFALILKVMIPIIVLVYFRMLFQCVPIYANRSIEKILWASFFILILNFMLGAAGLGKNTYQIGEDEGAGSTGLIMAGNELGGAFLVAFGFALHKFWTEKSLTKYVLLSLFTILCGISVATKTTMLASVLIVFLIPIANEREKLYRFTQLKAVVIVPLVTLGVTVVYLIVDILEKIGLYDRIMWFYHQRGLVGIVLSGRDEMAEERADIVFTRSNLFEQLFGQGQAIAIKDIKNLASVEIDSIDIFNFYGVHTLIFISSFYIWGIYQSHKQTIRNVSDIAPYVLTISFLLMCLSQLSGHIWTSGTTGILLGAMLALIFKHQCPNFRSID